jgi:tetratricopeptide repeat protein 30
MNKRRQPPRDTAVFAPLPRYYAKRCFLALAENLAKHMLTLKDSTIHEIIEFLDAADLHGGKIKTTIGPVVDPDGKHQVDTSTHTVTYEARQLKRLYLKLLE